MFMSFKKEGRCPECHSPEFWHRPEIQVGFGYTGALWGTATTPGWLNLEQFTCAKCGLTQFYATNLKDYTINKHTEKIREDQ